MQSVSIIGVGRVGGALALALPKEHYSVDKLFSRNTSENEDPLSKSNASVLRSPDDFVDIAEDLVFIATQDSEISNVAEQLSKHLKNKKSVVFHTSGSRSSDELKPLSEQGFRVGSVHPLVSISDPVIGVKRFEDSYFCVEGDEDAVAMASELVRHLGGKSFTIKTENKALYHASAVTACGHLVALFDIAANMLASCGMERSEAKDVLLPLVRSTIENLDEQSTVEALTGTFARGDLETLEKHIASLSSGFPEDYKKVYLSLGKQSLLLAKRQGTDPGKLNEMKDLISAAGENIN